MESSIKNEVRVNLTLTLKEAQTIWYCLSKNPNHAEEDDLIRGIAGMRDQMENVICRAKKELV